MHNEVGPVEDSPAVKGFDEAEVAELDALLAGTGAGEAAGALLHTSFLPEIFITGSFAKKEKLPGRSGQSHEQSRSMVLPDKEGA